MAGLPTLSVEVGPHIEALDHFVESNKVMGKYWKEWERKGVSPRIYQAVAKHPYGANVERQVALALERGNLHISGGT